MDYNIPDGLSYSKDNCWMKVEGESALIGITDVAVKRARDIAFIELPRKGSALQAGKALGQIESAKWAGEIISPVSGEVLDVNKQVEDDPSILNKDPYANWLIKVKVTEKTNVMDAESYRNHAKD
jgi:glycine cleavage system H protein